MPHTFVIFGASGDLTSRKLVPALYNLMRAGLLPDETRIIGFSRTKMSDGEWKASLRESTKQHAGGEPFSQEAWNTFEPIIHYQPGDIESTADFEKLQQRLCSLEEGNPTPRVYYLATAPRFYTPAIAALGNLNMASEDHGDRRIVIEKPFGTDLATAKALNNYIHTVFGRG